MQKEDGVRAGLVTEVPFEVRFSISGFVLLAYSQYGQSGLVQAKRLRRSPHTHASQHPRTRERSFRAYRGILGPPLESSAETSPPAALTAATDSPLQTPDARVRLRDPGPGWRAGAEAVSGAADAARLVGRRNGGAGRIWRDTGR